MSTVMDEYYDKLFNSLLTPGGKMKVANDFRGQMKQINSILSNDVTGLVSTITEYMVHSGTVDINFNSKNDKLNKLFSGWKDEVNVNIGLDIPSGLRGFTEQYFRERWKSSFIAVILKWKNFGGFNMPTRMYIVDGSSIYVKNDEMGLNTNEYYLGKPGKKGTIKLENTENQTVIIRKPYNQWYSPYPVPYLVRKGTLYHSLFKTKVLERQADIIETAFPYQLLIKVGTQESIKKGMGPTQPELDKIKDQFQKQKKNFDEHILSKGLVGAFAGDVNLEELMPDYKKALNLDITRGVDKNILSSLGMIELKGFSTNREESILNPKVLVEEVQDGVNDYAELLSEVVKQIKTRNSGKYTLNDKVEVQPGIIKTFLTAEMKTLIRSWYDRGLVGDKSGLENTTDLKFPTQVQERKIEKKEGLDKTMYPRIIQNMEKDPVDLTDNENTPEDKKKGSPEADNFKNAGEEIEIIKEPMKSIRGIPNEIRDELDKPSQQIFKVAFNEKFKELTTLEYDDFLREKVSMIYAFKEVQKDRKQTKEI